MGSLDAYHGNVPSFRKKDSALGALEEIFLLPIELVESFSPEIVIKACVNL